MNQPVSKSIKNYLQACADNLKKQKIKIENRLNITFENGSIILCVQEVIVGHNFLDTQYVTDKLTLSLWLIIIFLHICVYPVLSLYNIQNVQKKKFRVSIIYRVFQYTMRSIVSLPMVLLLDGSSEHSAHIWRKLGLLIT